MKRTVLAVILGCAVMAGCSPKGEEFFYNPVIRGDMADPTLIRIGKTYYAAGTSSEWAPFYPMFKSRDLVNWEPIGHVFDKKPEWTSTSFWAPELFYHNNTVFCYYTARRASDNVSYIGVATAKSPEDEFTDHGVIIEWGTEAIDAFVYDDNGQLYISWKAYGLDRRPIELIASKLSADGLHLEGEPFSLLVDNEGIGMEGQYHFKKGDYYYIVYAAHGCCGPRSNYDVYVARSKNFAGPYEKYEGNPILHGGEGDFLSSGHGTAVETPDGRMFFMCHAYLKGEGFYAGRQPILQEMVVGDDDWVHFTTGNVTKIRQPMPFKRTVQKPVADFEDNFNEPKLRVEWSWNYGYSDPDIKVGGGKLTLSGTPKDGNDYGTALCLRASSPNYTYETKVAGKNESFKGLTFYGDNRNLVAWGVAGDTLTLKSVSSSRNSPGETILRTIPVTDGDVYLKVKVIQGCMLDFFWSADGESWNHVEDAQFNGQRLVPWDRVPRPGIIHSGLRTAPAEFAYFKLANFIDIR